ncbi:MAG TPA: hypothetical protein VFL47_11750 [Flavisolibacter sp.]|nr:hypothetical protein [Flavisolibacter sp.]
MKKEIPAYSFLLQCRLETEQWRYLIADCREQLVSFKSRLAELINESTDEKFLQTAEKFQEDFLAQDNVVDYLSDEVKQQQRRIEKTESLGVDMFGEVASAQTKIRGEIQQAEELFTNVKSNFIAGVSKLFQKGDSHRA